MKPAASLALLLSLPVSSLLAAEFPFDIRSDATETKGKILHARGNILISHLDATLEADKATYNPDTKQITLEGNVRVAGRGIEHRAEKIIYHLNSQKIEVKGPSRTKLKSS
jgi:lipopolysaccharide assembly outer membrane protein LptD (OstA)